MDWALLIYSVCVCLVADEEEDDVKLLPKILIIIIVLQCCIGLGQKVCRVVAGVVVYIGVRIMVMKKFLQNSKQTDFRRLQYCWQRKWQLLPQWQVVDGRYVGTTKPK
ncbi:hypothetical protein EVAR_74073_1 [Eumeta japonica]|uniref:Uncharacterized protein n=1 Tax=Eumeta variegata TaxID=151549 RepID=A0A4C1TPF6_EUMVA|nr:hypothetical protein EVAR_74073_1 [Eumeta japonica]